MVALMKILSQQTRTPKAEEIVKGEGNAISFILIIIVERGWGNEKAVDEGVDLSVFLFPRRVSF